MAKKKKSTTVTSPEAPIVIVPAPEPPQGKLRQLVTKRWFKRVYLGVSLIVLMGTTLYWSILGGLLNNGNADQLINSYLFQDGPVFKNAELPSQHSFLLKWPVFYLIHAFNATPRSFVVATVVLSLLTVLILAFLLWRIERRPLVLGTLLLALSSVLLLVPAQPYPGALLPVNMAMVATRNVEYIMLLVGLYAITAQRHIRNWKFWGGVGLLVLLIASDKLFMSLIIGGGLMALLIYVLAHHWRLASMAARWLVGGLAATIGATLLLSILGGAGVTHFAGQQAAGPYGLVHSAGTLIQGVVYGLLAVLTNFGANPASGVTVLKQMPHQAVKQLLSPSGLPLVVNLIVLLTTIFAVLKLTLASLKAKNTQEPSRAYRFSLALIWVTVACLAIFVGTNHYYAGDTRYVGVVLFAGFVCLAVYLRQKQVSSLKLLTTGVVLLISIGFGVRSNRVMYKQSKQGLQIVNSRNTLVAQALKQHPVQQLVGDYWRVYPTKLTAENQLNVTALEDCTTPRRILGSTAWRPDLERTSFAYLLSLDEKLTDYPSCNINQVTSTYGRPNSSLVIDGTLEKPRELLLFYDQGARKNMPKTTPASDTNSTVTPISLDDLPHLTCPNPTTMTIVAHQDDDLLFMNPDIKHAIDAGNCMRTVYVTAGDAGAGSFFWLSRQKGSEEAYSKMLGFDGAWVERIVKLNDKQYITVANPKGNSKVSIIFMHLPDGNLTGQGFAVSQYESLAKLEAGQIGNVHAIDGESTYTAGQLADALAQLMHAYQPSEIYTQAHYVSKTFPDHSDHMAVGRFTERAYKQYETEQYENKVQIPLRYYIGYPIRSFSQNVLDADLEEKQRIFFAYAKYDDSVCHNTEECSHTLTYGSYLQRQYQDPN